MRCFGLFILLFASVLANLDDGQAFESDRTVKRVDKDNDIVVSSDMESRARLILLNGNMHFRAGKWRNITFDVSDKGGIFFRDLNILDIPSKEDIIFLRSQLRSNSLESPASRAQKAAIDRQLTALKGMIVVTRVKQMLLDEQFKKFNATKGRGSQQRRIRQLMLTLNKQVDRLYKLMKTNECEDKPCLNGGTCLDLFAAFHCLCPAHMEGIRCEKRLDECAMIKNTHADCQNGGTCVNNLNGPGTTCKCPANTYGAHCEDKSGECSASSTGLCGEHGHCVSITPAYSGAAAYKCVCDYGYKSNEDILQPLCVDIDECAGEHTPCFKGYGNECVNLPGTFKCAGCPKGFFGDGITCEDINECYSDPCSQDPRVECINTKGSFTCSACPIGYEGDGFTCKKIEFCASDPCNEEAACVEEPNQGCLCPDEKPLGSGMKGTECQQNPYFYGGTERCAVCKNGATCQKLNDTHATCFCPPGYHGDKCEFEDKCFNDPDYCGEVGTCYVNENDAYCVCPNGFITSCGVAGKGVIPADTCGMEFIQDSGNYTMQLPFYNSRVCTLTMKARDTRKILKVWISNYNHSDLDPGFDNIHAVEVKLKDSTNTWRYQIPTRTAPYYTKNGHLHVIFFIPTLNDTLAATVHWEAVEPICGGRLDVNNSPFSFKSTKAWEECQWFLDAPNDQLIEVTVEKMISLSGKDVNCTINSLRFYDSGLLDKEVEMAEICADIDKPFIKRFSTNHASLQFTYDSYAASADTLKDCRLATTATNNTDSTPKCGVYFLVSFKGVPKITDCGGVIDAQTNPVGFIQTPNYGHAYPPDLLCVWEFKLKKDNETLDETDLNMFTLDVIEFDVRGSIEQVPEGTVDDDIYCPGDFAEFDDITKHCNGNRLPTQLHFFDEFKLEFHSDAKYSAKGFKMMYKASCYHSFSAPTGIVRSPNLRTRHHEPFTCLYNINAPNSAIVKLKFDYIGLPGFSVGCLQLQNSNDSSLAGYDDYIELSGGHTSEMALNRRYHCSRYPFVSPSGELVVSGTSGIGITYSTSGSANNTGFLFSYTVEEKGCGGYFHGNSGIIKSPNHPNKYPNHMYCIYEITTTSRKAVRLIFDDFDVENVASRLDCGFDAVEIYESYTSEKVHGKLLGRFCGVSTPPPIVSANGKLAVVFTSDRSVNGNGFSAHFDTVDLHNFCDVVLTQQSGVIEFNRSNYGVIEECNFRIVLPAMARIHLNITDLYMPCEDGRITMRNGGHLDSPGFPQLWPDSSLCDNKPIPELITQGNQAFIQLSVRTTRNTTFRMEYKMISQSCGGYLRGYTGEIATPQYPKADSHQLLCEWEIAVAEGNRIRFQINQMDDLGSADHHGVCQPFARNYIDLAEGPKADPLVLRKYCKREVAPEPLITNGNHLIVKYNQVGGSINGGLYGFLGQFVTVCSNILLTGSHGSIQSPGYPYPTEEARLCSWTIKTSQGSRIRVNFHRFRLANSLVIRANGFKECMSNYLAIRADQVDKVVGTEEGKTSDKMRATKFCDDYSTPTEIYSKSNELQFNFTSTKQAKENHFWLSWSTIGCGGTILRNDSKLVADVDDFVPANMSARRECDWIIRAPIGYVVKVNVSEMHTVEQIHEGVCPDEIGQLNGVMFFSGTNITEYPQWSYCGSVDRTKNMTYTSHTNELSIRLGMDAKYTKAKNGTVFKASVMFVKLDGDKTCSGVIKILPGHNQTITSPGFPQTYPKAMECSWQFETVKGFSLAFNLSHFVTPGKRRAPPMGFSTNIRCSSALMYIEGGLAVYSGEYVQNNRLYSSYRESKGAVSRICNDITEPVLFNVLTNESTVTFHGAPYEATVPSGDNGRRDKIGFVLEAFAVCGGTLEANSERKTLSLREHMLHNNGGCSFMVERENKTALDQKIVVGFELVDLNALDDDQEVFINVTCGTKKGPNYASTKNRHMNTVECMENILIQVSQIPANVSFVIHYDTVGFMCGEIGEAARGAYEISGDIDCDYKIENSPGNNVILHIDESAVPESDDCIQSYVEIREGPRKRLLSRLCGTISPRKYEAEKLYLRVLRKPFAVKSTDDDEEVDGEDKKSTNWLKFRFEKSLGGLVKSSRIVLPIGSIRIRPAEDILTWTIRTNSSEDWIELSFHTLIGVKLKINEETIESIADNEPTRIFNTNELEISSVGVRSDFSHFELTWKPLRPASNNTENAAKIIYTEEEFTCGGELEATFTPKNLTLPTSDVDKYANDLKCRWKIRRPLLHGISFKLKVLDVEEHPNCGYDYLTVGTREFATVRELEDATFMHRICRKEQANYATLINYDDEAYIYFVSDRSRSFSGFTLEYKLDCRTFEYLNAEKNKFVYTLNSPLFPETGSHNFSCMWGIMLETNRDLMVRAISMDLAPPQEDNECKGEYLLVNSVPHSGNAGNKVQYYCGNNLFNYTAKYGRVFITFESNAEHLPAVKRQGFQLLIEEITHTCSETLYLDEIKKKGVIMSPGYPDNSPNSLDCEWTISAPPGHRIKFTVDPEQFMLENADPGECKDDFLEIHDGPSQNSPLIGRYCGEDPPSSLFSTDSHLFVRFGTDFFSPSEGWKATYELASCGGTVVLSANVNTSITSPNFPESYPAQADCEWLVKAPRGHFVEGHLKHLWLAISEDCKQESVAVIDGDPPGKPSNSTDIKPFLLRPSCSMRSVPDRHFHSHHDTAVVRFVANASYTRAGSRLFCLNRKCGFEIELAASKYECGGVVEDDEGQVVVPGYPDQVLPGIECIWNFRAGIGYRYKLGLEFLDEDGFYENIPSLVGGTDKPCFPDLEVWNGQMESRYSIYAVYQRFCANKTAFVSNADLVTVVYEDRAKVYGNAMYTSIDATRFHKPFKLLYTRVDEDFDDQSCMWHVFDDQNITIHEMSLRAGLDINAITNTGAKSFCHIRIENPKKESTVTLFFTEFHAGRTNIRLCGQSSNQVHIVGQTLDEWPIKDVLCSGIVHDNVYNNSYNSRILDVYIMNNPFTLVPNMDQPVQFNLSIVYNACGGDVTEEIYGNFGTIRPPGTQDGGNYSNNANCLWHFKAPEGQVVKLSITKMDLEYDVYCDKDVLEVAEGLEASSRLHRFCNSEVIPDAALEDRFKRLISRGQYLTVHFHSNDEITGKGFEVEWEFVTPDSNTSCGFHTHAMEGEIMSPGYPDIDYPNYASCLWEITVPTGFHIKLNFDHLDIAKSAGCLKDYLAIYQEHQSRGKDPMRNYLFYFDHDELMKRICGIDAIAPMETESRRVRLNFTTNDEITARGFRLTWEAKCGTVFQLNHGEVMSPFYPNYYPNEDMECIYHINPPTKYTQIVTIRIDDLELDDSLVDGKRKPCGSDYVEIIDVAANRVAFTACGRNNEEAGFSPISIKGPVAVRFVTNTTFFQDKKRKRMRGFHLTYALSDCGGEILLDEDTSHMTGTITSPSFPLPYHHQLNCVWNVTAPDGYVIAAKFRQMDVEGSEMCYFDYIELWDGLEMANSTTWGRICGQTPPFGTKMTKTNNMLIKFHTDETTNRGGFSLVLTATLGPEKGCGGDIKADKDWRTIHPPMNKGENVDTYMNNLRCWWRISAEKGDVIEFKLSDFDLEQRRVMGNGSCYDFLAIYDGPQGISPWLLRPSCAIKDFDDEEHLHYYSSYRQSDVYFETDSSDAFGGFTLQFRATEPACGGVYNAKAGEDQLIVYDSVKTLTRSHQRYKRCRFFIRGEENEPIELTMNKFSFPSNSSKCLEEFFEVSDVGTVAECQHPACATEQKDAQNVYRTCGSTVFWRFVSKTSLVQIVTSVLLQSQYRSNFNLTYTLLDSCNRTITIDDPNSRFASGRVHSPNFPYQYDPNSTCITTIEVPDEFRVLLVFKTFMIERGSYTMRRTPYWNRIRGAPGTRGIPSMSGLVRSKRDLREVEGLTGGTRSSEGVKKDLLPSELLVRRRRYDFRTLPSWDENCKFDALRVTYNLTLNTKKTLCGFMTPSPVLSAQNTLILNFTSDGTSNHGGFDANYYLIKTYQQEYQKLYEYAPIYEKNGAIANLGFPSYDVNSTYRAFIIPPRGMTCHLDITRFLNKDLSKCNEGDVLKVGMVTDEGDHWVPIECADELNLKRISPGVTQAEVQSFKIEFNTDSSAENDGRGFKATWECEEAITDILVTDQWDTKLVE